MNGKLQSSDVKNETPYNIPLLINENVISSGISLISALAYLRRRALPGDLAAGQRNRLSPTHGLRCIPYKDVGKFF